MSKIPTLSYTWGIKKVPVSDRGASHLGTERERHLTTGKRAVRTKLDFPFLICRCAIGQAS